MDFLKRNYLSLSPRQRITKTIMITQLEHSALSVMSTILIFVLTLKDIHPITDK